MKKGIVLVVTGSKEISVKRPLEFLIGSGANFFRIDIDKILDDGSFDFSIDYQDRKWTMRRGDQKVSSEEIISVWYRRPPRPAAPILSEKKSKYFIREETKKALWSLWTTGNEKFLWMNHPITSKMLEFNKPFQLLAASNVGLKIPKTFISSNPQRCLDFIKSCGGEGIIKVFGSPGLKDKKGRGLVVFTNRVNLSHIEKYGNEITCCPVMLENYVPKKLELRITVVGEKIFPCAIYSQDSERTKDDWRKYDFKNVKHERFELPKSVERKLLALMRVFKLNFGAIDMILTPKGEFVFLEINPNGQWGWIERLTEMPISETIANVLIGKEKPCYRGKFY